MQKISIMHEPFPAPKLSSVSLDKQLHVLPKSLCLQDSTAVNTRPCSQTQTHSPAHRSLFTAFHFLLMGKKKLIEMWLNRKASKKQKSAKVCRMVSVMVSRTPTILLCPCHSGWKVRTRAVVGIRQRRLLGQEFKPIESPYTGCSGSVLHFQAHMTVISPSPRTPFPHSPGELSSTVFTTLVPFPQRH